MQEANDKKVRVGVVGVGIGSVHLHGYRKLPNVTIAAVCDVNAKRAEAVAAEFKAEKVYADYQEMLSKADLDAVSICTPNFLHADSSIAALEAGKHVICEKPMANTLESARRIVDAARKAERRGLVFMMGMNNRFRGDTQVLKKFIESGDLGEIYYAKCGWERRRGIPGAGGWFTTKAKSGGGPLIDLGVHVLDVTMYLMGNPAPVGVYGATYAKFGPRGLGVWEGVFAPVPDAAPNDVEDLAAGMVKFDNGATLMIEASWASHVKRERIYSTLLGSEGGADLEPLAIYKDIHGTPVDITPTFPNISGHEAELKHFVECIVSGKKPISNAEQGLHVLQILDALYRSAESGREVVISR